MLEMRKDADRRHRHWQDVLAEVTKDLTHAEMRLAGQVSTRARTQPPCGREAIVGYSGVVLQPFGRRIPELAAPDQGRPGCNTLLPCAGKYFDALGRLLTVGGGALSQDQPFRQIVFPLSLLCKRLAC